MVQGWCIHHDLIPQDKVVFIPDPEVIVKREPPLFIDLEEVIYHNHPTLRHRVLIEVIEVVDWHQPLDSSNDDNPFRPCPKMIRFSEPEHDPPPR
jgi:hypothetical protein